MTKIIFAPTPIWNIKPKWANKLVWGGTLLLLSSCISTGQKGRNISPADGLKQAEVLYKKGEGYYDREKWEKAQDCFDQALKILLVISEKEKEEEFQQASSELLARACLFQVRLRKVVYGVKPEIDKDYFSLPIVFNPRVEQWITYYMTRGRKYFSRWLKRSGKYLPLMRKIFKQHGLPEDMVYVALVESGYNPHALSPKQAVGFWQFIKETGKRMGLQKNHWIDERKNPEKATHAAAQHLKNLYKRFDSWELALAAYNCGAGRIQRSLQKQKTKDYWELILPAETENYVPKVYASIIIAKEPEIYGFSTEFETPHEYEEVNVKGCIDLKTVARASEATLQEITDLNPELSRKCTPPGVDSYPLRVPYGKRKSFVKNFAQFPKKERYLSKREINKRKLKGRVIIYRVKRGDTLWSIARRFKTKISYIKKWNKRARKRYLHPGDRLRIYRLK